MPDKRTSRNNTDSTPGWNWSIIPNAIRVSARTGAGIPELIAAIVAKLVPVTPEPGEGVPYTPELAGDVLAAYNSQQILGDTQPPHP